MYVYVLYPTLLRSNAVCVYIHCESKKQHTKLLPITSPNINRFSNFLHDGLGSKFAPNSCINLPPPLKHVAILPCEIRMSENCCRSEICIVINDKSQGSIVKHFICDVLLHYTFIIQPAGERIFNIGEHLVKLQAKRSIVSCVPFALHF